jgi:hypothetical protein
MPHGWLEQENPVDALAADFVSNVTKLPLRL